MAIIDATKKAILLEIRREGRHGYELRRVVKRSLSTVYGHLWELQRAGLVEARARGRRKIYTLTKNGEMLLRALQL